MKAALESIYEFDRTVVVRLCNAIAVSSHYWLIRVMMENLEEWLTAHEHDDEYDADAVSKSRGAGDDGVEAGRTTLALDRMELLRINPHIELGMKEIRSLMKMNDSEERKFNALKAREKMLLEAIKVCRKFQSGMK